MSIQIKAIEQHFSVVLFVMLYGYLPGFFKTRSPVSFLSLAFFVLFLSPPFPLSLFSVIFVHWADKYPCLA